MKIVEINYGFSGSTGNIMLNLAKFVNEQGGEVYTFSAANARPAPNGHSYFGTRLENLIGRVICVFSGISEIGSVIGTVSLIRKIEKIKPNILHLHNLHGWYLNLPLLFRYIKKRNIRTVWTLHDCWGFTAQCSHFEFEKCDKWKTGCHYCPRYRIYPYTFIDRTKQMWKLKRKWLTGVPNMTIVTPSKWLAALARESYLNAYPIKVIHNGIDLDVFKPTDSDFVLHQHLQNKKIILGIASSWNDRKGLAVFLEISKKLDGEKYQIVLVGTDDAVDKLLPENIISIHRTENSQKLAEIYTAADVFINPTREDTFPSVNIEALACGTPVITARTGGSSEIIDESCGIVVEENCAECFCAAIDSVCEEEPIDSNACIKRARKFDTREKAYAYFELYNEIIQHGGYGIE